MAAVLLFIRSIALLIISAVELLMFARAILSWLPIDQGGAIYSFIYALTEPIIAPIRAICNKIEFFRNSPIDASFIITMILLFILQSILTSL